MTQKNKHKSDILDELSLSTVFESSSSCACFILHTGEVLWYWRQTFLSSSPWEMFSDSMKPDTRWWIGPASPQWGRRTSVWNPCCLEKRSHRYQEGHVNRIKGGNTQFQLCLVIALNSSYSNIKQINAKDESPKIRVYFAVCYPLYYSNTKLIFNASSKVHAHTDSNCTKYEILCIFIAMRWSWKFKPCIKRLRRTSKPDK